MSLRRSSGVVLGGLMLMGCSRSADSSRSPAATTSPVPCAHGTAPLAAACTIERDAATLTLRNPDGGFHRLLVTRDGRGVVAADGAQPAVVSLVAPTVIEVRIGDDRYRLPATVGSAR